MQKIAPILFLLLVSTIFAAFELKNYMFPEENENSIKTQDFALGGDSYSLIKIGQEEVFLLKNGEPLQDKDVLNNILKLYYKSTYYPKNTEIQEITDLLIKYNKSRNDGGRYPGKEEAICKQILLLNGIKYGTGTIYCNDDAGCEKITQIFYSATYAKGVKKTVSFETALLLIKSFGISSNGNDKLISESLSLMNNANEDSLEDALQKIKENIPLLRQYKSTIENSEFRTPTTAPGEVQRCIDEKCFAICPDFSFDGDALNQLESKINGILTKSKPFFGYRDSSQAIYDNTVKRLLNYDLEIKAREYLSLYEPYFLDGQEVIKQGKEALVLVNDESLKSAVNKLTDLTNKINESIKKLDFTGIDNDLQEYTALISEVSDLIPNKVSTYNASISFKKDANVLIFILETKDLDQQSSKRLDELRQLTADLNSKFYSGLTNEEYEKLALSYKEVSDEASILLKNHKENPISFISSKFRSFARRVNYGVVDFLETTKISKPREFTSNKLLSFGGVSVLTFLSLSSILFFVFATLYYTRFKAASNITKFLFIGFFVFIILFLMVISSLFYIFLDKTALAADLEEFVYDMGNTDSATIAVDLQDVPLPASSNMLKCASLLSSTLSSSNKSVKVYQLGAADCSLRNSDSVSKSKAECIEDIKNSTAFILKYSSTSQKPKFSTIYDNKAYITGDNSYYDSCIVSTLFK